MKKQILSEELKRMKTLAGLISENDSEDYERTSREVEYGINPYADEDLEFSEDESISSKGKIGKNYPDEVHGEYEGELESIPGAEIKDLVYDMLEISNSEEDFIRKMTYALTNEDFKLSTETEQKLRSWYKINA